MNNLRPGLQQIWNLDGYTLSENLTIARKDLFELLNNLNTNLSLTLLNGVKQKKSHPGYKSRKKVRLKDTFTQQNVGKLVDFIFSSNTDFDACNNQVIILALIITEGNKNHLWIIPQPAVGVKPKIERNPFTPSSMKEIKLARSWSDAVSLSLTHKVKLSDKGKVGQVLLSGIIHGGLLHKDSITAFFNQMTNPVMLVKNVSYINLSLRWRGKDSQIHRRWFIDPFTEMLLFRLSSNIPLSEMNPSQCIRQFFIAMRPYGIEPPKSLTKLTDGISLALKLDIEPFLIDYANHKNLTHSLKENAWLRLHNKADTFQEDIDLSPVLKNEEEIFIGAPNWDKSIKQALKEITQRKAIQALKSIEDELDVIPLYRHIKGWAISLLSKGSSFNKQLSVRTVSQYVSRLGSRLYGTIGEYDITEFDIETIEDVYTEILENEDVSLPTIARILREFHHFLVSDYGVPELSSSLLDTRNIVTPVNANIISIDEYQTTLNLMSNNTSLQVIHPDVAKIGRLLTIIAFRCGLRRQEALKLRLIDFQGEVAPEILIRRHSDRRLKSKNSIRRIRLMAWLTKTELEELKDWVAKRRKQEEQDPYSQYIFSIPEKRFSIIPEELIFPIIHKSLREATNDSSVSFHSLRHSCASWNTLRLLVADIGVPERFFEGMPETLAYLQTSKHLKKSCYSHDEPTRKHLYVISALLGHSSPAVTLEHYIHWCDLLLNKALEAVNNKIPKQALLIASGLRKTTVYRHLEHGTDALINVVRKSHADKFYVYSESLPKLTIYDSETPNLAWEEITRAWQLLYVHSKYNRPLEKLTEQLGYTLNETENLVSRAKKYSEYKRKGRHKTLRFRFTESDGSRLLCPSQPKTLEGKTLAADFAQRLFDLSQRNSPDYKLLIKVYLSNARYNSNELVFSEPKGALVWMYLLKEIGITNKHLTFIWHHGADVEGIKNSVRRQYWRDHLKIPKRQAVQSKKINSTRPLGVNGSIGIRINDYLQSGSQLGQSTDAFRFVITMLAIIDKS